jgi:hypothetical protein
MACGKRVHGMEKTGVCARATGWPAADDFIGSGESNLMPLHNLPKPRLKNARFVNQAAVLPDV